MNCSLHESQAYTNHTSCTSCTYQITQKIEIRPWQKLRCGIVALTVFSENFQLHPPRLLIAKFSVYGFDDNVLKYMYTYLKSRKQCVRINNASSEFKYIISGVRWGSINGSFLFNAFLIFFSSALETRLSPTLLMIVLDYQVPGLWTCYWKY